MSILDKLDIPAPAAIQPFRIVQLITGLERGPNDESLLKYLNFLSTQIPIEAAYFLHVTPSTEKLNRLLQEVDSELIVHQQAIRERILTELGGDISRYLISPRIKKIQYEVREGNPLEELLADAEAIDATVIAIGQRSRTNSHGILAKNLVRKVPIDALVIPDRSAHQLRRIMVPVDFSAHSAQALQKAVGIIKQMQEPAEIIAVNVYEMPAFSAFKISKTEAQLRKMVHEDRREALQAFVEACVPEEYLPKEQVLIEKERPGVGQYLWDYAAANNIDFIVMGAKGHSRVELLLLGSTTERLLTINDSIPTLVVR
ncbi:MAG: hypothetical protein D6772_05255 [Bacteroidetes bacterium]|nr:MAG: hypothetical protein D6772_05255 [Bacteroidota bacterium]